MSRSGGALLPAALFSYTELSGERQLPTPVAM